MIHVALIYLAFLHVSTAQNATSNNTAATCDKDVPIGVYNAFNISSNNTIPAFQPPNTSPANWTLHFGVSDTRNATDNSSETDLYMWLDSTDEETDLNSPELPYMGCLVRVSLDRKRKSTGSIGEGDGCAGVFSEKCYNALVANVKASAMQDLDGADMRKRCLRAVDWDTKECEEGDGWSVLEAEVFIGNGTAGTNGSDGCGDPGVTEGAQLRTQAFKSISLEDSYDNHTRYDNLVANASPYFLIGIMKNGSSDSMQSWGDARLVCATPGGIQPSAATRRVAFNGVVYAMLALGISLMLSGVM